MVRLILILNAPQTHQGITQSIERARKNLYQPGIKVTDPISNKNTDIFTLMENNEKRYKFIHDINKKTANSSTLELSDALSIMEGGLKAVNEFISENGAKSKMGFWIQATGGVGKLVTYGQIGVEMTTGDPRKAAGMLLAEGINVAVGVTVTKAINKVPYPHPLKPAAAIALGTGAALFTGKTVTSIVEKLTDAKKQADTIKESMSSRKSGFTEENKSYPSVIEPNIILTGPEGK